MGHIYEIKEDQESSLRLHFIKFETKYIEMCIDFIQENILSEAYKDRALKATGMSSLYNLTDLILIFRVYFLNCLAACKLSNKYTYVWH